jgi:hypothetical protein
VKAPAIWLFAISAGSCAASSAPAPASQSASRDAPERWFTSLPSDARIADFSPGRFASTVDQYATSSCSMSWASASSRATVVLDLRADGSASGCRGRRYESIDGPNDESRLRVHETRYIEQQGMRGRWHREGRGVVVDLDLDATVCAARAENVTPKPWHLRCAAVERTGSATIVRRPLLVCGWLDAVPRETPSPGWEATAGYTTQEFIPGSWLVLAPGPGARLTERGLDESVHPAMDVKWTEAATPIPFDDWSATAP